MPAIADIVLAIACINLFTYLLFWFDKWCAKRKGGRIPEYVLLLCCIAGGSPGGWLSMKMFRHKTKKTQFRVRFWLVVLLQVAAIIYVLLPVPHP